MRLLTVREFCEEINVARYTVYKWLKEGRLEGVVRDHMGVYLIPESNLKIAKPGIGRPRKKRALQRGGPPSPKEARDRFNSMSFNRTRQVLFSYDELDGLFNEDLTYQQIADMAGVSRQRIEQIYSAYFAPFRGTGKDRRKNFFRKEWKERAKAHIEETEKLSLLKREAEKVGFEVRSVQTPNNPSYFYSNLIIVNDKLCGVYYSIIHTKTGEGCCRTYYRFNISWAMIEQVEFIIVLTGEDAERTFIIPSKVMLNLRRTTRRYKTWYVPSDKLKTYNNQYPDIDWWSYESAWNLLESSNDG